MYLFVYGTLKRGSHPMAAELWAEADFAGKATVEGALFDFGKYPGMVEEKGSRVQGELARLRNPEEMLARLDRYEGPEYKRSLCAAEVESGGTVEAFVYKFAGRTGSARRIESGRWG